MASAPATQIPRISIGEYYRLERESGEKHDWYDGEIYCMSGGTTNHNTIKTNLTTMLVTALRGRPCRPLDSDQRLKLAGTGLRAYPDAPIEVTLALAELYDRVEFATG